MRNNNNYFLPTEEQLKDPLSSSYTTALAWCKKMFLYFCIADTILYTICALIIFFSNVSSNYSINTISFFGLQLDADYDSIFDSVFIKYIFFTISYIFYSAILYILITICGTFIESKINLLNNTYKTAKLTEWWIASQYNNESSKDNATVTAKANPVTVIQKNSQLKCCNCELPIDSYPCKHCGHKIDISPLPIRVFPNENGNITCPVCGKEQRSNRSLCLNCGQKFINGQPNIPYWCGKCGHEGPFEGSCPECGSSIKIMNI